MCAVEGERYLRYWWYDDGTCLGLEGCLPADSGAVVATALDRLAGRMPDIVSDDDSPPYPATYEDSLDVRRVDALVALASAHIADDADPDRATVVVHAPLAALDSDDRGCELERGPVIHPETMRRQGCDCRLEILVHDALGNPVGIGRAARNVPQRIIRALRHRDRGCTFPGCGAKWFLRHITSGGGDEEGRPTSTTSCCAVTTTTSSCTRVGGT